MAPPSLCSGLGPAWQKNEATRDRAFCAEIPEAMPNAHVVEAIVYDVEESPFAGSVASGVFDRTEAWQDKRTTLRNWRRGTLTASVVGHPYPLILTRF